MAVSSTACGRMCVSQLVPKKKNQFMCCGSIRGLWASLPWSFLSVRETKVFSCLLPYLLECQVHSNSHARPENLAWLFEAPLCFRKHPFHLMVSSVVLRQTEHHISWKRSQETAEPIFFFFSQYCNQESKFLFFSGQVPYTAVALVLHCLLWLLMLFLLPQSHTEPF